MPICSKLKGKLTSSDNSNFGLDTSTLRDGSTSVRQHAIDAMDVTNESFVYTRNDYSDVKLFKKMSSRSLLDSNGSSLKRYKQRVSYQSSIATRNMYNGNDDEYKTISASVLSNS